MPVAVYAIRHIHSGNVDPRCHPSTRNSLFFFGEESLILFSTQQPNDHFTVCVNQTKSCFLVRVKSKLPARIFSCHDPSDVIFCHFTLSSFQPPWLPCHFTNMTSILLPRSLVLAVLSARMPFSQVSSWSALPLLLGFVFFFFKCYFTMSSFLIPRFRKLTLPYFYFCCIFLQKNVSPLDSHEFNCFFLCLSPSTKI